MKRLRSRRRIPAALVLLAVAAASVATFAQQESGKPTMAQQLAEQRNFDARVGLLVPAAAPLAAQQGEVRDLLAVMPDLRAEFDPATGATKSLWNMADYLTPADARDPRAIAEDFMASRAALLGLSDSDVVDVELTNSVYSAVSGVTHLYYRQRVGGIPVYNGQIQFNVTRDGRILSVNNAFLPNLTASLASLRPALDAAAAVVHAGEHLGVKGVTPAVRLSVRGIRQATDLVAPELSTEDIKAELMVLPISKGQARLVWNFQVWTLDSEHAFDFTVDAETGQVWTRFDWVAADSYRVYRQPVESPNHSSPAAPADGRTVASNPADATASPFGWHDTNGAAGAEFTTTQGNNAHAYADTNNDGSPDAGSSPSCGAGLNCDFTLDLTQAPSAYQPAAVTNLFYWNNVVHDVQYRYGFDEAGGNFQVNNYGRGGTGNDDVRAEAQDGGGTNNANFLTPADGSRPRMQMYLWNTSTPNRDGDFDAGVVVHEYGHGISNRQVGGPANVSCMNNAQQPGEGISDWLALAYTALPGHTGLTARGVGTYVLNQPTTGPGIRPLPYSTDGAVNNWTYESISGMAIPHGVGAVWAQGMWEVYWALVDHYGFSADLYNATGGAGNQRAMLYHNEGLKNAACSPGFTQVRDGIIQAAQTINGGADVCRLWDAFAGFGLGADAVNPSSNSTAGVVNGFSTPTACGGTVVPTMSIGDATVTEGQSGTTTASFTVSLSAATTVEVRANFATADGTATAPSDYAAASGQVVFAPGELSQQILVTVNGDTTMEPTETFTVTLTAPVNAVLGDAQGLGTILADDGVTTFNANPGTLGAIPDGPSGTCQTPGAARDVTFSVTGLGGTVTSVGVTMSVTHTWMGDLRAVLLAPGGAQHVVFGYTGATTAGGAGDNSDLAGPYTFEDTAVLNWWLAATGTAGEVPSGTYRTSQQGGVGATSAPTLMNPVFASTAPNGTWTLRFTDGCQFDTGTVTAASLALSATSAAPSTVDDAYVTPFGTPLNVAAPGVLANDNPNGGGAMAAVLVSGPASGSLTLNANGSFTYTPNAGFAGADSFTYRAQNATGPGNVATVGITVSAGPPTTVNDGFVTPYLTTLNITAPGVLANDGSNGGGAMTAELLSTTSNGTLSLSPTGGVSYTPDFGFAGTDSFTYRAVTGVGPGNVATVTIMVNAPTTVQAPYNLRVDSVVGNTVTLRWDALPIGPQASTFILEGGLNPGEVLASIPSGHAAPIFTFVAPTGSFFIRMHGQLAADKSPASNEVRLHVNVPVAPSAPANLLGTANGSTVSLEWKNTFGGAAASGLVLDVTGSVATSLPLTLGERFSFTGVPGGNYTFRLRATNAGGSSAASAPINLSFPAACPGVPAAPANLLAHRLGSSGFVVWDPPASGPAPTGYVLNVTGAFVGSFATPGRVLSGPVAPGSYNLSLVAANACGTSAPATTVLVVP